MFFNGLEAFTTDDMLNFAGVFGCRFGVHAERSQPGGEQQMPFVDFFSDRTTGFRECNKAGFCDSNMIFHGGFSWQY